MNYVIDWFLVHMISEQCIKKEEREVYQFGIECLFLKIIHYASYLIMANFLHSVLDLMISACILVPLRSVSGGYHAKSRIGCYIFSCSVVIAVCLLNKQYFYNWIYFAEGIVASMIILLWAPVENENRILDDFEKCKFHKKAKFLVLVSDVVIIALMLGDNLWISGCLLHGMMVAAVLLLLEKRKLRLVRKHKSANLIF